MDNGKFSKNHKLRQKFGVPLQTLVRGLYSSFIDIKRKKTWVQWVCWRYYQNNGAKGCFTPYPYVSLIAKGSPECTPHGNSKWFLFYSACCMKAIKPYGGIVSKRNKAV